MKTGKRLLTLLLALAGALTLTGCQLAREDGASGNSDALAGYFLTREPVDPADGGALDSVKQGRFYATWEEGPDEMVCTFGTLEGEWLYSLCVSNDEGTYRTSDASEGIVVTGHHYSVTDEGNRVIIGGTLYCSPAGLKEDTILYLNPVFQQADGQVYLIPGDSFYLGGGTEEGQLWSQTMTTTTLQDGTVTETTVTLEIEALYRPEAIVVMALDEESQLLSRTEYLPGQAPEVLFPGSAAAFLLVETRKTAPDGTAVVSRALIPREEETFTTFSCREDGICVAADTQVRWTE